MLVSSFNLSQSFNYTPYLFYKKTVQNRDQLFLYMDPGPRNGEKFEKNLALNVGRIRNRYCNVQYLHI